MIHNIFCIYITLYISSRVCVQLSTTVSVWVCQVKELKVNSQRNRVEVILHKGAEINGLPVSVCPE